jgi:hypothetical protein
MKYKENSDGTVNDSHGNEMYSVSMVVDELNRLSSELTQAKKSLRAVLNFVNLPDRDSRILAARAILK